jgi:hypothetical protein
VQGVAFDPGDPDAFPTEALGVPGLTGGAPGEDGVEAGEEEEIAGGVDGDYGLERDMGGVLGVEGVDDVGVASGDGAELVGVGTGVDAGGHGGVGEAEGAGSQELSAVGWADEKLERTACVGVFFAGDLLRVCELTCRGDVGWGFQDLGGPGVGEGLHLEDRLAVAGAMSFGIGLGACGSGLFSTPAGTEQPAFLSSS